MNEAITVATKKNIPPLKGSTLLLVSVGEEMKTSKMASKSNSKNITSALDVAFLFANMCSVSCENVEYISFDNKQFKGRRIKNSSLLDATKTYSNESYNLVSQDFEKLVGEYLMQFIRNETRFDNVIIKSQFCPEVTPLLTLSLSPSLFGVRFIFLLILSP